jgi:hypothetical protein
MVKALSLTSGLVPENFHETIKWALFCVQFLILKANFKQNFKRL